MKTLLSLVLFLVLSTAPSFAKAKSSGPTQNALQGKLAQYLNEHLKSITTVGDVAVLKSDGSITQSGGSKTIVLKKSGDKFSVSFGKDKKGRIDATFTLNKVKKKHVQLDYRATETKDGKSSKDEGQIILDTK